MRKLYALLLLVCGLSGFFGAQYAFGLDTWTTWATNQPAAARQLPPSVLTARGEGTNAYYVLEVDPVTGELPVSIATGITVDYSGATGSAVPADAAFVGGTDGTNLRGIKTDSGGELQIDVLSSALPSGAATDTKQDIGNTSLANIDAGTPAALGQTTMAASMPVVLPSNQSAIPITDNSGSITVDGTVAASNFPSTADTNSGAAGASTIRTVLATRHEAVATPLAAQLSNGTSAIDYGAGAQGTATVRVTQAGRAITSTIIANNNYGSTSVTTSAYVQLISSTASAVNEICVANSSGSIIKLATGGAGAEVDRLYVPAGGALCYPLNIAASTRVSLEALDATASTGYFLFTGLP